MTEKPDEKADVHAGESDTAEDVRQKIADIHNPAPEMAGERGVLFSGLRAGASPDNLLRLQRLEAILENTDMVLSSLQARAEKAERERDEILFLSACARRRWYLCDLTSKVGHFNRADLCEAFGISVPQASADIKRLIAEFPALVAYNKSTKRYERIGLPAARHRRKS